MQSCRRDDDRADVPDLYPPGGYPLAARVAGAGLVSWLAFRRQEL